MRLKEVKKNPSCDWSKHEIIYDSWVFQNVTQLCVNVANQLDKIKFQAWLTFKYSIWALHFVFIALLRKHLEMSVESRN